jgi:hypothetical protein
VTREQNALKTANEAHDRRRHEYEKYVKYKELQEEVGEGEMQVEVVASLSCDARLAPDHWLSEYLGYHLQS